MDTYRKHSLPKNLDYWLFYDAQNGAPRGGGSPTGMKTWLIIGVIHKTRVYNCDDQSCTSFYLSQRFKYVIFHIFTCTKLAPETQLHGNYPVRNCKFSTFQENAEIQISCRRRQLKANVMKGVNQKSGLTHEGQCYSHWQVPLASWIFFNYFI